jgi:hypothetical protein
MTAKMMMTALALATGARAASAEDMDTWFSFGGNIGYGMTEGSGLLVGGEVSLFKLNLDIEISRNNDTKPDPTYWIGGYADAVHDFGANTTRFSIGPEIGYGLFGLDGGYLFEAGEQDHHGLTVRGAITVGFVAVYARYSRVFGADDPNRGELGLLFKVPLPVGK